MVQVNLVNLASNDDIIAIFCLALSLLAIIGARYLGENVYLKYLAASLSFFLVSNAASILKSIEPGILGWVESLTQLFSLLSISLAAYRYRKVAQGLL